MLGSGLRKLKRVICKRFQSKWLGGTAVQPRFGCCAAERLNGSGRRNMLIEIERRPKESY
jgi:hypothetical protein